MVLISHADRFVYTKTVKTASTSVELYLQPLVTGPDHDAAESTATIETARGIVGYRGGDPHGQRWFNHMPLRTVQEQLGADTLAGYFKFCCVRDPFDKLVSAFFWFERGAKDLPPAEQIRRFRAWLDEDRLRTDWRTAFVFDRDKYSLDGTSVDVDAIIRYEHLREDLARVLTRLGNPDLPGELPRLKTTSRSDVELAAFYGDAEIEKIHTWFAFEFDRFDYAREPRATRTDGPSSTPLGR